MMPAARNEDENNGANDKEYSCIFYDQHIVHMRGQTDKAQSNEKTESQLGIIYQIGTREFTQRLQRKFRPRKYQDTHTNQPKPEGNDDKARGEFQSLSHFKFVMISMPF